MKTKLFFYFTFVTALLFCSCKKNNTPAAPATPAPTPSTDLFINFSLDGVAKSFTSTNVSINTAFGGGSSTSSGFFNANDNIHISLHMPLDSIMGSDLQGLVGTKLPIGSCGGCPTNIEFSYEIGGDDYKSSDAYNTLPNEYIKFNSVTFQKNVTVFDENLNQYYVTGEFNVKINSGTTVKSASSGTFGLIFRESKH